MKGIFMNRVIVALTILTVGTAFSIYIVLSQGDRSMPESFWTVVPYVVGPWIVLDLLPLFVKWWTGIAIAGGLMLVLEIFFFFSVFINPQNSTAALVYLIKPFVQLLLLLPIGLVVGRAIEKRRSNQKNSI